MKILMVAQTDLPIPSPKDKIFAPGIIFDNIARGLKGRGHEVTVFASADSDIKDILITDFGITSNYSVKEKYSNEDLAMRSQQHQLFVISAAFEEYKKERYDLLFVDSFPISEYFSKFVDRPIVCIHHGVPSADSDLRMDVFKIRQKKYFNNFKFIAISENQKRMGEKYFNYIKIIHHGIDINSFNYNDNPKNDLLFLGRINQKKGTDVAISVALKSKGRIDIWGDNKNDDYWREKVKPQIDGKNVKYHGHCDFRKVSEVYGQSRALLVPISWDEPFGLVIIEAMACGTPVIAYNRGSVSELIVDGVTGFIIEPGNKRAFVDAVKKIDQIDRKKCREHVEKNFSVERMVDDYEKLFKEIIANNKK